MNSSTSPPRASDRKAYVFVDHREWLPNIVEGVSRRLAAEDTLTASEKGTVIFHGQEHRIPLTMSPHDQYVVISSLAELLKDHYRFFLLAPSLDSDTHGLLVAPAAIAKAWDLMPKHLTPLQLGFDYFGRIDVPYLNHEDAAPNFAAESETRRLSGEAVAQLYAVFLTDDAEEAGRVAATFAKAAIRDPSLREFVDWPENASETEIAALVAKAIREGQQDPGLKDSRSEFDNAMQELWKVTGGPPKKPWF